MYKTVEKAIKRIARYVERETGSDITDFLCDAADNYEYDFDGNKATCDFIIRGLENEADMFIRLKEDEKHA